MKAWVNIAVLLASLPAVSAAQERIDSQGWTRFASGPFEVYSNAGDRPGRRTLGYLEQLRHSLGSMLGREDLSSLWPVRVLVVRNARQFEASAAAPGLGMGRDAHTGVLVAGNAPPRELVRDCVRILIESGPGRMDRPIESGLEILFSTLLVDGTRVTLGTPPPPEERNLDWARLHLLAVDPNQSGKLRVLLYNLQRGMEAGPAYRNAFGRDPEEIEAEARGYLKAGSFRTTAVNARPMNPDTDFHGESVEPGRMQVLLADVALAAPGAAVRARAAYEAALKLEPSSAAAREGLGLLALREGQAAAARDQLLLAVGGTGASVRAFLEYGRLEKDPEKAAAALMKATELKPGWAEPFALRAAAEPDAGRKAALLLKAANADPRSAERWRAAAEAAMAAEDFPQAVKAWARAEAVAADPAERGRIVQARRDADQRRIEKEAAERRREIEERRMAEERAKNSVLASIRAAEERANRAAGPSPGGKVEEWWEDPKTPATAQGILRRVDCLGTSARLSIEQANRKVVRILVKDPSKLVLRGGEQTLACGVQRTVREVVVGYYPKPDAKLGTAGEAAIVEFR